ncbi:D-hexose-6-phosphate mutarotase [Undibacterium sp.]|jgi:glucose-6-phosphate 1-epimerase|uniref:D-hexose-6-phosphate mutarotase n=1 Tax=Undibacterium sp. TaxID=1914977 RepID=UPI002C216061|nr:D-hexose-6-phosphate mutarotase [Undibacterium sp.]HTD06470.1 D-hexose-6-phosphate mutarotase [Undibacterium sp.]
MEQLILRAEDGAQAAVTHHGAHLCSWIPAAGKEQLFLSKTSEFRDGAPIRGGVPVVFPQFAGLGSLPKHGFARTSAWRLLRSDLTATGAAQAVFGLHESIATIAVWPYVFRAELTVTVSGRQLDIALAIENSGDTAFSFTAALHTYCAVHDIADVSVHGLAGLRYRDSASGADNCVDNTEVLRIDGEIDRIYADAPALLELRQPAQTTLIKTTGFSDAVVWNPGALKGATLADLEPDGFRRMLCVEAAAIMRPVQLPAGARWTASQSLQVLTQ